MNLIEVMMAALIGAGVSLTIGATMNYSAIALNTYMTRLDISNLSTKLKTLINNENTCKPLIVTPTGQTLVPNPPQNNPSQNIWLTLPATPGNPAQAINPTGTGDGVPIMQNLNVAQANLTKLQDANLGANPSYINTDPNDGAEYYPILGQVNVLVRNMSKQVFGAKDSLLSFPIGITFKRTNSTSPWTVSQCGIIVRPNTVNLGWASPNLSDPNTCVQGLYPPQLCPEGMYMVKSVPKTLTSSSQVAVTTTTWKSSYPSGTYWGWPRTNPSCVCAGTCKGCVCVVASECSATCNGATGVVTDDQCRGTCVSRTNCQPVTTTVMQTVTTNTPTVEFSCCRVKK